MDNGPLRQCERLRGVDLSPAVQASGQGRHLHRRTGLLYGTGHRQTLDGSALRSTHLDNIRFCIQLGTEQYHLRLMGTGVQRTGPVDGHHPHDPDPRDHLRRHPAHRRRKQSARPRNGSPLHRPGASHHSHEYRGNTEGARPYSIGCIRLRGRERRRMEGTGRRRHRRHHHAGRQARNVQQ